MPATGSENAKFVVKVLIAVSIVVFVCLIGLLAYFTIDVILLVFAAILLSIFLRGLADLVNTGGRLSEGLSVFLVSTILLIVLAGAVSLLAPDIVDQYRNLRTELPKSWLKIDEYLNQFGWGRAILEQLPDSTEIKRRISEVDFSNLLSQVGGYFSSTVGAIGNFFIMILLAIYLASEPRLHTDGLTKLFPITVRPRVSEIVGEIGNTLQWWLIGKTVSMIFIGLLTWIGLSILGVPLALTLGLIAGLLSFIPNFGPIFSAVPAILLAFIDSPIKALYVLILFIVVQLIESNLVTPYIERRTVELPPALTVAFQIVLGVTIGGLGLVLATPILAVLMVLVQKAYIEGVLGDPGEVVKTKKGKSKDVPDEPASASQEK
ncbi:MAG: AI-2E family transporter [Acidobacteria bacterium]|nr:AI-2E family transporter [Acidobacteriota bacterium]MBK8809615.1 AI-2E family transporter [Acidobacteriota bacterium]